MLKNLLKIIVLLLVVAMAQCTPTLDGPIVDTRQDWCGAYIETHGNSIAGSPLSWPCVFSLWAMADAMPHSRDNTHNFFYPGADDDSIMRNFYFHEPPLTDRWERAQIIQLCENGLNNPERVIANYQRITNDLEAHGNHKWLVQGCINENKGIDGFPVPNWNYDIVKNLNAQLFLIYRERFIDPNVAFIPFATTTAEVNSGMPPIRYTLDGRHLNQAGAIILGRFTATYLKPCPVIDINSYKLRKAS